jgi:hypothetical protein
MLNSRIFLALDLGKLKDPAAFAAVEVATTTEGKRDPVTYELITATRFSLRYLRTLPLGTPYPAIARKADELLARPAFRHRTTFIVDAGGPGIPFLDYFHPAANLVKVIITSSGKPTYANGFHHIPRQALLHNLAILIQKRILSVANIPEAKTLLKELAAIGANGKSRAPHDDLAIATALAAWQAAKCYKPP